MKKEVTLDKEVVDIATEQEINLFLREFKTKLSIWDVVFTNRQKNTQTLFDLEISPSYRKQILAELIETDFSKGPLEDKMIGGAEMWIFGKSIKKQEVYIKITLGNPNFCVVCISFHIAEHRMNYPLK